MGLAAKKKPNFPQHALRETQGSKKSGLLTGFARLKALRSLNAHMLIAELNS